MNKKTYSAVALAGLIAFNAISIPNLSTPSKVEATNKVCTNPAKGVLRDKFGGTDQFLTTYYMNKVTIKNTSKHCSYKIGIGSYKAYEDYRINVYSQTHYMSKTTILKPGKTWEYTIVVPKCTYQVDVFWGDTIYTFQKPNVTYGQQGRLLDAWYFPGNQKQRDDKPPALG